MRTIALVLALAAAAADVSPKRARPIPVETLGNAFARLGDAEDGGLTVSLWHNQTLDRDETWHQAENGEWFLKVRDGLYLLTECIEGGYRTAPKTQLVRRDGVWTRVTLR